MPIPSHTQPVYYRVEVAVDRRLRAAVAALAPLGVSLTRVVSDALAQAAADLERRYNLAQPFGESEPLHQGRPRKLSERSVQR